MLENNLKIDKLISVSGFNNCYIDHGEYDSVNKSMYVKDITKIRDHVNKITCIISENDPYVKYSSLTNFANKIADEIIDLRKGGHFNTDSGYGKKFEDLLYYATKK